MTRTIVISYSICATCIVMTVMDITITFIDIYKEPIKNPQFFMCLEPISIPLT